MRAAAKPRVLKIRAWHSHLSSRRPAAASVKSDAYPSAGPGSRRGCRDRPLFSGRDGEDREDFGARACRPSGGHRTCRRACRCDRGVRPAGDPLPGPHPWTDRRARAAMHRRRGAALALAGDHLRALGSAAVSLRATGPTRLGAHLKVQKHLHLRGCDLGGGLEATASARIGLRASALALLGLLGLPLARVSAARTIPPRSSGVRAVSLGGWRRRPGSRSP